MKTRILSIVLLFIVSLGYGQFSDKEKELLFPKKYTFEQAEKFESEGRLDRAIWIYINLYPEHKEKVIEKVKLMQQENDTLNMPSFIINSFSLYATFDPVIANWDNGYPMLNKEMLDLKGSWGDALIIEVAGEESFDQEVMPIKTENGIMVIFNYEKSKFTIRIEGDDAKMAEQYMTFIVDNRVLQITTVELADVPGLDTCKNLLDSLSAHMQYELDYLEKSVGKELTIRSKELLNHSGRSYYLWSYKLPSEMQVQLENQYILTTIIGDKLLMLYTAAEKDEKERRIKKHFKKFYSSIVIYDDKMDIKGIIDGVKNE